MLEIHFRGLGGLFALTFEAILKVVSKFGVLCNQGHYKSCAHLHQVHYVVVGHLRCHDGADLCCFTTGGIRIYNASELLGLHQWRQVTVVLGDHQYRCSHLLRQIVNGDAF